MDSSEEARPLSVKQRRFADFYLGEARGNATQAARLAGYSDPEQSAFANKQNVAVRAYIDERLMAETMSAAEVLRELTDVASAEWQDFIEVKTDKHGRRLMVKMDLTNKVKSLELLGKHHKLFTDKVENSGDPDRPTVIRVVYDDPRSASTEAPSGPSDGD